MALLNVIVPTLGLFIAYSSRELWLSAYHTLGVVGTAVLFAVFAAVMYWLHVWTLHITKAATSYVIVDDNGKITCRNWGLNQSYNPAEIAAPRTLEGNEY